MSSTLTPKQICFAIDRGGTFTDIYAFSPDTPAYHRVYKLLSVDPENYDDAPREGIRRILEEDAKIEASDPKNVDSSAIGFIRMGTTVATNALLERKGERTALFITSGFKDLLQIGNQARPEIFDLEIKKPELLYESVVEIDERVQVFSHDYYHDEETVESAIAGIDSTDALDIQIGTTGEKVRVLQPLDEQQVKTELQGIFDSGIRSLAVVLMHAYTFPEHEKKVGEWAEEIGFTHVSLSSQLMPMVRAVPRGHTSCVDAYLTPVIKDYIASFESGFDDQLKENVQVSFMQSDGGLTPVESFSGFRAILSGPAGGVVGYAMTTFNKQTGQAVIGFDMGGTSTDVSRFDGRFEHIFENTTAGVTIQAPQLDINTVAAGGGSRLFFRSGMFVVGPESASAHPGPVCYRKNGYLAVTDANLLLGRINPEYFPKIFGPDENQGLDVDATRAAFQSLTDEINEYFKNEIAQQQGSDGSSYTPMTPEQVALGFIKVANAAMARPVRNLTEAKGHNVRDHILACFGGAGPQHACEIAKHLGMSKVFVHKYAGILSAYGIALADVVCEAQEPAALEYSPESLKITDERLAVLNANCVEQLKQQEFDEESIVIEEFLNIRYQGTDTAMMILRPTESDKTFEDVFLEQYQHEYGFLLPGRPLVIDDVRVRGIGKSNKLTEQEIEGQNGEPEPMDHQDVYFDDENGFQNCPVFSLPTLGAGATLQGPCIIYDKTFTTVVLPSCVATITTTGNIEIDVSLDNTEQIGTELDLIHLSVFAHRFMGIAEQMGRTLQRTSISTNIKERLDFSCAIFGPDGGLVANAPHLPVHLGSMSEAVKWQIDYLGDDWKEGEVLVSNHPKAGGSHLPDITVITPVFSEGKPVFYVASRGHHADIGGITPGSMPPFSKALIEEGACIKSFKLVENGVFQQEGITEILYSPADAGMGPNKMPNSGTRNIKDNLSDLQAQVAANNKGIQLVTELIEQTGLSVVMAYMKFVQDNAELAVRDTLKSLSLEHGMQEVDTLHFEDYMDDGTPIHLGLTIDRSDGSAVFDFTGTGAEVYGNCNAPTAVTLAAILYSLRCLVNMNIPLNCGCLKPIEVIVPENTILSPSEQAAVVGGNVLTSQRVTDVILSAFGACANSQGCMNNFTFGNENLGYYETIAGGAGAGPSWHGQSGVQTHMTNTRITDVEVLERRYPVLVKQFGIRHGSGGHGKFRGGDGVIRDIEFLEPLTVGILSERRSLAPNGIQGGGPGAKGLNLLVKKDGRVINIGGKNTVDVEIGDRFSIQTPGGGGYGEE